MYEIILTVLITAGVLVLVAGVALWVFVEWMENDERWFYGTVVNWSFIF